MLKKSITLIKLQSYELRKKLKRCKLQISEKRRSIPVDHTNIKLTMTCNKQLHGNKFNKVDEMDIFF